MNDFIQTLCDRKSCRSYRPEQITETELSDILRAGTYAASAMGRQPSKIVVLQDPEEIANLERMNAEVMGKPGSHPCAGTGGRAHGRGGRLAGDGQPDGSGLQPRHRQLLDQPRA